MGTLKCGCIIADSNNTISVRKGFEMGGYVKQFCDFHLNDGNEEESENTSERFAAIGAAKILYNYIEENNLPHPCLRDDLADFISGYDTEDS